MVSSTQGWRSHSRFRGDPWYACGVNFGHFAAVSSYALSHKGWNKQNIMRKQKRKMRMEKNVFKMFIAVLVVREWVVFVESFQWFHCEGDNGEFSWRRKPLQHFTERVTQRCCKVIVFFTRPGKYRYKAFNVAQYELRLIKSFVTWRWTKGINLQHIVQRNTVHIIFRWLS